MRSIRIETSKKILWLDLIIGIVVTITVIVGNCRGLNMAEAAMVAGFWDTQLAAVVSFYLWKSKNENRSKHAMALVRELADKYGIESAAHIAEIVLKE